MKETDFPTNNCRSATEITQLKTTTEKQRQRPVWKVSGRHVTSAVHKNKVGAQLGAQKFVIRALKFY